MILIQSITRNKMLDVFSITDNFLINYAGIYMYIHCDLYLQLSSFIADLHSEPQKNDLLKKKIIHILNI